MSLPLRPFQSWSPRARLIGRRSLGIATILVTIWAGLMMGRKVGPNADGAEIAGYWTGDYSRSAQPDYVVASTAGEWEALWGRIGRPAPTPFPDGRSTAVGILLGIRDPGYGAQVISTATRGDKLVVVFEEKRSLPIPPARVGDPEAPWTVLLLNDRPRAVQLEQRITR